jgi:hypothetical protein
MLSLRHPGRVQLYQYRHRHDHRRRLYRRHSFKHVGGPSSYCFGAYQQRQSTSRRISMLYPYPICLDLWTSRVHVVSGEGDDRLRLILNRPPQIHLESTSDHAPTSA